MGDEKMSPGPWRWGYPDETTGHLYEDDLLYAADGTTVGVEMRDYDRQKRHKNNLDANAALIADAPAMLELLRVLVGVIDAKFDASGPNIEAARALLEKHGRG